jgi:lipoate-protein ligase A
MEKSMTKYTEIIRTKTLDPWWNLAVEEYLLYNLEKDKCILYLWQNQNTVVIGRNQNAWRECRTKLLEEEGGKLARRLSGGGAVFHDTGNLNFTFLMNREDYNLEKQVGVILSAVKKVGIAAEMTGRNDLTVDGKKFSGNAFCFKGLNAYHHGTILVTADIDKLTRYLQVSTEKIRSKGIESVRSRVTNLAEYNPELTVEEISAALMEAFGETYGGLPVVRDNVDLMDQEVLKKLYEKYSSWEWRYGETAEFDIEMSSRFSWGGIEVGLQLEKGIVKKAMVYSDALDEEFIIMLPKAMEGCIFRSKSLAESILNMNVGKEREQMQVNIADWIRGKDF